MDIKEASAMTEASGMTNEQERTSDWHGRPPRSRSQELAAKDDAAGARLRRGDEDVDGTMARRVAADSVDDFRHEVRLLASAVEGLRKNQTRPMARVERPFGLAAETARPAAILAVAEPAPPPSPRRGLRPFERQAIEFVRWRSDRERWQPRRVNERVPVVAL